MLDLLWLVPALPLLGFVVLFVTAGRLPPRAVAIVGVGSIGLSAVIALLIGYGFLVAGRESYSQLLWNWIEVDGFRPQISFYLDPLSLVMMLIVTFVGLLIHLYSTEFMKGDEGYSRFFSYMNLFVAEMLILVLGGNLLLLYVGWEGVGLCSYLLIGFWWRDPANGAAACKAFVMTRIGDTAMAVGLFLLFTRLGTLDIQELMHRVSEAWPVRAALPTAAAALLLGGAVGKSAQLPLQTWLPDAMAGPTPVSALIHAATMVTAGVYLIARTHVLFAHAPAVQTAVAVIGAATLLLAAFSALNQHDIKRILAYSTMSQIGYMFMALGAGAWTAAIFHLMTHAFFKALLFLAAGAIIMRVHQEHDIFRMGGLRRRLPVAFWSFLIGSASLAALPLVTAGFYSKDLILLGAWYAGPGGPVFWAAGITGAFLTAIYIFRAVFIVFFGEVKTEVSGRYGAAIVIPLVILSVLSVIGGFIEIPPALGGVPSFSRFMQSALPLGPALEPAAAKGSTALLVISAMVSILGVYVAYLFFLRGLPRLSALATSLAESPLGSFLYSGWAFDWLYDRVLVRPFLWLAWVNRSDVVDAIYNDAALLTQLCHYVLSRTQTGQVRWYAGWVAAGSVAAIAIAVFA